MGSWIFQVLLLGVFMVLFMDEGDRVLTIRLIRYCNQCEFFDGYKCIGGIKSCWKFNIAWYNRSCRTDHMYYYDRPTARYLYRYTKLSCETCEAGMNLEFHDLMRETYCCVHDDRCNDPDDIPETAKEYVSKDTDRIV
uniref:Prostate and testis expressed 2 n=1 Tax=Pipistrellus kuhlii TaxID=59472 RepID=A0A7J7UG90_PIPKU|nr:hypothetical protein mPipKuh1_009086 [Pipistrellus kuhlii]